MDLLTYKTYSAIAEFDADSETFQGRVLGIRDVVTFQGTSVTELEQAFQDSVDDYLDFCKSRGEKPDKPYSGKFVLRIAPALHRNLSEYAEQHGQSLNSVVETLIANNITTPATSKRTTKSRRKA